MCYRQTALYIVCVYVCVYVRVVLYNWGACRDNVYDVFQCVDHTSC